MDTTADFTRATDLIKKVVAELNEALGYPTAGHDTPRVTFGYIGNCGPGFDDRTWMVFLPHPGRVGTSADRIGGFRTNDVTGARVCVSLVHAATKVARLAR